MKTSTAFFLLSLAGIIYAGDNQNRIVMGISISIGATCLFCMLDGGYQRKQGRMTNAPPPPKEPEKPKKLNTCQNYGIKCVYALSEFAPMPCCVPSQEACYIWRAKVKASEGKPQPSITLDGAKYVLADRQHHGRRIAVPCMCWLALRSPARKGQL